MSETPSQQWEIDCRSVHGKLKNGDEFLFLDCREVDEHTTAKIDGTTLVPMSEIDQRLGELEPHKEGEVIVHCHHGGRSLRVAHWLAQQGFANVKSMAGGIEVWAIEIDTSVPRY